MTKIVGYGFRGKINKIVELLITKPYVQLLQVYLKICLIEYILRHYNKFKDYFVKSLKR